MAGPEHFVTHHLLPPPWSGPPPETLGLLDDPGVDRRAKFRGALLGGAIGDALGRPAEGKPRETLLSRYGTLRDYVPWSGWKAGPRGTYTDDTQLTICVAESLLATDGVLSPADLASRFVAWLPVGRGKGRATTAAVERLARGVPWDSAGEPSAGNGAAMRVAPVGLVHGGDADSLRRDAALSAVITHAHAMAVASAVAQAFLVAWCSHRGPGALVPSDVLAALGVVLDDVADPGEPGTWPGAGPEPVRLIDRLVGVAALLGSTPEHAFDTLYNGAFVLESLPAALWCFLRSPDDAEDVIVTAVNGGRDADTVAAMAGSLVGAYLGEKALPERWLEDLEDYERIIRLADGLFAVGAGAGGASTSAAGVVSVPTSRSRILGCLVAGAVGDALGAPVEFASLSEIRRRFGPGGVTGYTPAYGRAGVFTDDTQMTLFTAEGLIRAQARMRNRGICNVPAVVRRAYVRWLRTQGEGEFSDPEFPDEPSGWLVGEPVLNHRRAPGTTCLSALRSGGWGSPERPINDSKGCGGVMRAAPVGLVVADPFQLAAQVAALTHGHPSGYLAAGALVETISRLMRGESVRRAVEGALVVFRRWEHHEETLAAVERALHLAGTEPVGPETVERLGQGWVAEEALAISVYCSLVATDLRSGLLLAVNHSGDSDSTGSITGNILGAHLGIDAVPSELLAGLEGRDVVEQVASDLADAFIERRQLPSERYPTW
jgi:ADP-ribosylglycohydrolase